MPIRHFFVLLLFTLFSFSAWTAVPDDQPLPKYIPRVHEEFPVNEHLVNFGTIYATQWAIYYYTQRETIEKHGSFHNWMTNPLSPRFDKDSFDYNIFKHTIVGQYYYLWYRSRGYTEKNAFFWTFISSLVFEFTIETITEKPSYQDIYQTPVFGTVVGVGVEKLSRYLHSKNRWYTTTVAYLLNPFTLIPTISGDVIAAPMIDDKKVGAMFSYRY
jgi:hypothetical protein